LLFLFTMKRILLIILLIFCSYKGFSQSRYVSQTTKKIVYTRDGGKCQCCGSTLNLEYDHITPFSCGGSSEPSNIQLLCQPCNRSKSNSCYCKVHNTLVGTNCCDSKSSSRTETTATQCIGTTKKGLRCKKRTASSTGRCHLHQ
jgi:hypothetical protein